MKTTNTNKLQKIALIAVTSLFAVSFTYNINQSKKTNEILKIVEVTPKEKTNIVSQLEELKVNYANAIAEKTSISNELISERNKAIGLIAKLKLVENSNTELMAYKESFLELNEKMEVLLKEVANLKVQNKSLVNELNNTQQKLDVAINSNDELEGKNDALTKSVSKASKLVVLNLKATSFKLNGMKQVETEKAKKSNLVKLNFTIAENKVIKPGDKVFFVQIIDNNSNVVGDKKIIKYHNSNLAYTASKIVNFKNETSNVSLDVPVANLTTGSYFVSVFFQGELLSKTSLALN